MQLAVASKSDQGTRCVQNLIAVGLIAHFLYTELQAAGYDANDHSGT